MKDALVAELREEAVECYRRAAALAEEAAEHAKKAASAVRAEGNGFDAPRGAEMHALLLLKETTSSLMNALATASTLSAIAWNGNELVRDLRREARGKTA